VRSALNVFIISDSRLSTTVFSLFLSLFFSSSFSDYFRGHACPRRSLFVPLNCRILNGFDLSPIALKSRFRFLATWKSWRVNRAVVLTAVSCDDVDSPATSTIYRIHSVMFSILNLIRNLIWDIYYIILIRLYYINAIFNLFNSRLCKLI